MGDNGNRPSYKKDQKNVSVYVGKATSWEAGVLKAICASMKWRESQFFRNLFFDYLANAGLYDSRTGEPVMEAVNKLLARAQKVRSQRLPSMLDLEKGADVEKKDRG